MFLSRLCLVYHLWTDGYSDFFPFYGTQTLCPVRHLWTDEAITLFSFLS